MIDKSKLEFTEVKDVMESAKIKYRYNYINSKNELIFRYDNAKHHTELKTFPHHKHLAEKTIEAAEPNLYEVLNEAKKIILK